MEKSPYTLFFTLFAKQSPLEGVGRLGCQGVFQEVLLSPRLQDL